MYPHGDLAEYLHLLGIEVLDRMRSDCDVVITANENHVSLKTEEAARLSIPTCTWEAFAEEFQIRGFVYPPVLRYWETITGELWCEIDDYYNPDETQWFSPVNGDSEPGRIEARPVGAPFAAGYGPLKGRLVAEHEPRTSGV